MFIKDLHKVTLKQIANERPPMFREVNVGWPSEALCDSGTFPIGECRRSLFYKILGYPYTEKMGARIRKICDAGLMYEKKAINEFKNSEHFVSEQARIEFTMPDTKTKVSLSGKLDVVIEDDGVYKGIEIKTVYGYKAMTVFGMKGKIPLPAAKNLMQAMMYKYKAMNEKIDGHDVSEIYLMYINREDGCSIYFKVDIDAEGYPIIEPITMEGRSYGKINIADCPSFDELNTRTVTASSDDARYAELKININDIFKKFDETFSYAREGVLPPKDFTLTYDKSEVDKQFRCGKISKIKYNKHNKGDLTGDFNCAYCSYQSKCLEDEGIRLKDS